MCLKARCARQSRSAFTLVEILVVIAIVAILIGLLLAGIQRAREATNVVACKNHIRQIVLAVHLSSDAYQVCPPATGYFPGTAGQGPNGWVGQPGAGYGSIFFHILPFIEFSTVYKSAFDPSTMVYAGWGDGLYHSSLPLYACPSDPSLEFLQSHVLIREDLGDGNTWQPIGLSSYAYNMQVFGVVDSNGNLVSRQGACQLPGSIPDGLSNTIMFAEKLGQCGDPSSDPHAGGTWWDDWMQGSSTQLYDPGFAISSYAQMSQPAVPGEIGPASMFQVQPLPFLGPACDYKRPSTPHSAGIQVGMADGSARTLAPTISPAIWWSACTPAGGEASQLD
jgi:prepilin-type N-terminal cleavage/methylation domain-containing protein